MRDGRRRKKNEVRGKQLDMEAVRTTTTTMGRNDKTALGKQRGKVLREESPVHQLQTRQQQLQCLP